MEQCDIDTVSLLQLLCVEKHVYEKKTRSGMCHQGMREIVQIVLFLF